MTTDHTPPADQAALRHQLGQVLHRWGLLDEMNDPLAVEEMAVNDLLSTIGVRPMPDGVLAARITAAIHAKTPPQTQPDDYRIGWEEALDAAINAARAVLPPPVPRADAYRLAAKAVRETIAPDDWDADAVSIWNAATNIAEHRLRRMADEAQPGTEAPARDCPSDCPCHRVCIGRTRQPAAEAQQDGNPS